MTGSHRNAVLWPMFLMLLATSMFDSVAAIEPVGCDGEPGKCCVDDGNTVEPARGIKYWTENCTRVQQCAPGRGSELTLSNSTASCDSPLGCVKDHEDFYQCMCALGSTLYRSEPDGGERIDFECKPGCGGYAWGDPHMHQSIPGPQTGVQTVIAYDYMDAGGANTNLRLLSDPDNGVAINVHLAHPHDRITGVGVVFSNLTVEVDRSGATGTVSLDDAASVSMHSLRLWPLQTLSSGDWKSVRLEIVEPGLLKITSVAASRPLSTTVSARASFQITIQIKHHHMSVDAKYPCGLPSSTAHDGVFGRVRESGLEVADILGGTATLSNGNTSTLHHSMYKFAFGDLGVGAISTSTVATLLAGP